MEEKNLNIFMNLRTDFAFKKVFGSETHKRVVVRFLNILFRNDGINVEDVVYHSKEVLPADDSGKRIIYDVYCTTHDHRLHFILEMQQLAEPHFADRALYYTAKATASQGERGWQYDLKPVYSIFIMNFNFPHMPKVVQHDVRLYDIITGNIFSDMMRMEFICLPEVKATWEECETEYDKILFLIKNIHTMDKNSKAYKSGEFADIFDASEIASMAAEDVVEYSKSYARYEADQAAIAYAGEVKYAEGREAGIAEGEAIGMARGVENTARKLWKAGMDREFIKEITGLDIEDIL